MHVAREGTEGTTILFLLFRASKQGQFNLNLGDGRSVPIVIYPKDSEVLTLMESIHYKETEGLTTGMGNRVFGQSQVSLKVGDIFMIKYISYSENYEEDTNTPTGIVVKKSELTIPQGGYDHWTKRF